MNEKTLVHITTVPQTLFFLSGQVKYMKKKGFKVYVISSAGDKLRDFSKQEEVDFRQVNMSRNISVFKDCISLIKLIYVLFKLKPDIIHSHTPKASLLSMIAGWLLGVPTRIYHVHGLVLETAKGIKRRILLLTERITVSLSTQVLSVSKSLEQEMIKSKLCKPEKIKVILNGTVNGIDAKGKFKPAESLTLQGEKIREELNIGNEDYVLGFVGRFTKDKGIKDLIALWNRLKTSWDHIHIVLVGRVDSREGISEEIIEEIKKEERIHMVGYVENTPSYYSMMDVLIHPSYREGFGQVILEAAAMEVPTITYNVTGCKDAVVDGVTGAIVSAGNIEELLEATEFYINELDLVKNQGRQARERVLKKFNSEKIWIELYKEYT